MLIMPFLAIAQKRASEIGVVLDNDLYTSTVNDKYYTNGFEIYYRYLNKNSNPEVNKSVSEFRIGQYIYNPYTINANNIAKNDRPFAGYIFGRFGLHRYYQNESVVKLNFQLGYVGPNAFGEELQKLFHKSFGYKKVRGWQHQIENALAVQTNLFYSKKLFPSLKSENIDFHAVADVNAGTVLDGISVGFLSRISLKKLLPVYNSNLYDAALNSDSQFYKQESEFYFYIAPYLNYRLYDATIQGSMFNDNSPVTFALMPFRFNGEAGLKYRKNKLDLSYSFIYRGKEAKNDLIKGYFYGSIGIGYFLN